MNGDGGNRGWQCCGCVASICTGRVRRCVGWFGLGERSGEDVATPLPWLQRGLVRIDLRWRD